MSNLDENGSNSLLLIRFVFTSDLFYLQERSSGFDENNSFKDGLQGRIEVKQSHGSQKKKLGREHDRVVVAEATHGHV